MKKFSILFSIILSVNAFCDESKIPQKMRDLWENPITDARIENGIRANRMGEFYLDFDNPVENLNIKLSRHEFLFGVRPQPDEHRCKGDKRRHNSQRIRRRPHYP